MPQPATLPNPSADLGAAAAAGLGAAGLGAAVLPLGLVLLLVVAALPPESQGALPAAPPCLCLNALKTVSRFFYYDIDIYISI